MISILLSILLLAYQLQKVFLKFIKITLKMMKTGKLFHTIKNNLNLNDNNYNKNGKINYKDDNFMMEYIINYDSCAREPCIIFILVIIIFNFFDNADDNDDNGDDDEDYEEED